MRRPTATPERRRARRLLLAFVLGSSACDGGSDAPEMLPPDATVQLDAARPDAAVPLDAAVVLDGAPRLSELVESLFVPTCVLGRCHVTAAPAAELSFTGRRIAVHAALVNAASTEQPQRRRVVPFDPDASYLIEKLESELPAVGTPMPPMGRLQPEQIERVRAWIAAGALDD